MAEKPPLKTSPAAQTISETLHLLQVLGVPKEQQNARSALTLLALLSMAPGKRWADAESPMLGITEMLNYFQEHFQKKDAPNTRETVRRFTIHQFVQLGLVLANPDDAKRPVNSPDTRYQVAPSFLKLVRTYGSPSWDAALAEYIGNIDELGRLQPSEHKMVWVPVRLPDGRELELTPGAHNELIKGIVEDFCSQFTPGGVLVYVGDMGNKQRHVETEYLRQLGLILDEHGKMPDVVVHLPKSNWLVLIEAVTSHGPINLKRHNELKELFKDAQAGLVFVTAFLTRQAMTRYLSQIAWETEVWVADAPSHIIHFNGERFLGPYT